MNLQKLDSSANFNAKIEAIKERVSKWESKCSEYVVYRRISLVFYILIETCKRVLYDYFFQ